MTARRNDDDWTSDLASEDGVRCAMMLCAIFATCCTEVFPRACRKTGRVDDAFLDDMVQETSHEDS